jgi:hypothetical protein
MKAIKPRLKAGRSKVLCKKLEIEAPTEQDKQQAQR